MPKKMNSRAIILDAAEDVVVEMGATHLSLDAVAKKAGVSKGGLLYHFPSKRALLKGMMEGLIVQFHEDRAKAFEELPDTAGRSLKAGVMTSLAPNERRDKIGLSMLAALAHDRTLAAPLQQAYAQHIRELKDMPFSFDRAVILSLACDGLMFWELLGLSPLSVKERKKLMSALLAQVDEMEGKC